jgi:hypothetical protein
MNKSTTIQHIREAKLAHTRWEDIVKVVASGYKGSEFKGAVPVLKTDCEFGKWYYGEGMMFSQINSYQNLGKPHEMVHEIYLEIKKLMDTKIHAGFFQSQNKLEHEKENHIHELLESFLNYNKLVHDGLNQLEMDILKLTDYDIEKLI